MTYLPLLGVADKRLIDSVFFHYSNTKSTGFQLPQNTDVSLPAALYLFLPGSFPIGRQEYAARPMSCRLMSEPTGISRLHL